MTSSIRAEAERLAKGKFRQKSEFEYNHEYEARQEIWIKQIENVLAAAEERGMEAVIKYLHQEGMSYEGYACDWDKKNDAWIRTALKQPQPEGK